VGAVSSTAGVVNEVATPPGVVGVVATPTGVVGIAATPSGVVTAAGIAFPPTGAPVDCSAIDSILIFLLGPALSSGRANSVPDVGDLLGDLELLRKRRLDERTMLLSFPNSEELRLEPFLRTVPDLPLDLRVVPALISFRRLSIIHPSSSTSGLLAFTLPPDAAFLRSASFFAASLFRFFSSKTTLCVFSWRLKVTL
jgi:hypothetical protein